MGERVIAARIGRGAGVGDSVSFVLCGNNMAVPSAPISTPTHRATTRPKPRAGAWFLIGCLERIASTGIAAPYIALMTLDENEDGNVLWTVCSAEAE